MRVVRTAGAAQWKTMSTSQKEPWKQLAEESVRQYNAQKTIVQDTTAHHFLSKKPVATATALAKAKKVKMPSSSKAKAPLKSVLKKATKTGKAAKRVSFSGVETSTKNMKVGV